MVSVIATKLCLLREISNKLRRFIVVFRLCFSETSRACVCLFARNAMESSTTFATDSSTSQKTKTKQRKTSLVPLGFHHYSFFYRIYIFLVCSQHAWSVIACGFTLYCVANCQSDYFTYFSEQNCFFITHLKHECNILIPKLTTSRLLASLNPIDVSTLPEKYPKNPLLFYVDYHKKRLIKELIQLAVVGAHRPKAIKKGNQNRLSAETAGISAESKRGSLSPLDPTIPALAQLENAREVIKHFDSFAVMYETAYQFTSEYAKSSSLLKQSLIVQSNDGKEVLVKKIVLMQESILLSLFLPQFYVCFTYFLILINKFNAKNKDNKLYSINRL